MRTVPLSTLRSDVRLFANQRSTALVTDPELDRLINLRLARFYDVLVEARGHEYYEQSTTLTTSSGSAIVPLPSDFYELLYLAARWGAQEIEEIPDLSHLGDQIDFRTLNSWGQGMPKCFRMRSQLLEFFPTPSASTTLELRYIPVCPVLSDPAQTFDGVNGWEVFIASGAAIDLLGIQALPSDHVQGLYAESMGRIQDLAAKRAAAHPPEIRDVYFRGGPGQYWRRLPRAI